MEINCIRQSHPKGVLLLVVLSMLTLFLLLGTTFVVLSSRARTVSRAFLRLAEETGQETISMQPFLREAARQVIRGSTLAGSTLQGHDLLGDKYEGSYETSISSATLIGDVLQLNLRDSDADVFSARVISFLDGPESVRGSSSRIFHADGNKVFILKPKRFTASDIGSCTGATVLVNQRDFSGTGFLSGERHTPNWSLVPTGPGGSRNEDYDFWDAQNLVLARPDQSGVSCSTPAAIDHWVGVLCRKLDEELGIDLTTEEAEQKLFEYEYNLSQQTFGGFDAAQAYYSSFISDDQERILFQETLKCLRRSSLRPYPFDHMPDAYGTVDFAGQKLDDAASFFNALKNVEPDVDADGDGTPDSIWIDFGADPIRLADRSVVKPLVAVRCIDLGGRLSLNAHASLAHLVDHLGYPASATNDTSLARKFDNINSPPANQDINDLDNAMDLVQNRPSGSGYGPADVRLDAVLDRQALEAVLLGRNALAVNTDGLKRRLGNIVGRYGDGVKTVSNPAMPGKPGVDDGQLKDWSYASGGLPTDYWGQATIGRDHRGHPFRLQRLPRNEKVDNPYEHDLLAYRDGNPYGSATVSWVDQPYTAAELESLLRRHDADVAALMPQRALAVSLATTNSADLLTTDNWSSPAVIDALPGSLGPRNLELKDRIRLNVNRPFGDGLDNDNDGIFDEPDEAGDTYRVGPALTRGQDIGLDYKQPGPEWPGLRARQIHADNIFRLLKAIGADSVINVKDLAQWAVNVVDFIDPDRTMTPYKYSPSGSADDYVVWGCERPQAIITETLAFHDRAIAGTNDDDGPDPDNDPNFDQIRVPQGSLFVELQAIDASGVDLAQTHDGTSSGDPVWRLAFTALRQPGVTNNDPFHLLRSNPNSEAFSPSNGETGVSCDSSGGQINTTRYVWFVNKTPPNEQSGATDLPNKLNTFWPRSGTATLSAGQFLVVGPRAATHLGGCTTVTAPSPQQISLSSDFVAVDTVNSNGSDQNPRKTFAGWPDFEVPLGGFPETKTMVCRSDNTDWSCAGWQTNYEGSGTSRYYPVGLNITEPKANVYYAEPSGPNPYDLSTPGYGKYSDTDHTVSARKFPDIPADTYANCPLSAHAELLRQGTHLNVSTVFLQRLADPSRPHNTDANTTAWNPYIVVDLFPIDLHVFNGETYVRDPSVGQDKAFYFHTRQRGFDDWLNQGDSMVTLETPDINDPTELKLDNFHLDEALFKNDPKWKVNPWRPPMPFGKNGLVKPPQPKPTSVGTVVGARIPWFKHNLGYTGADHEYQDLAIPFHSLGFASMCYGRRLVPPEVPAAYEGASLMTPPWIVWKDAPLANPYELLLVPRTSASRLLTNYRDDDEPCFEGTYSDNPFGATLPFHHLMPFTTVNDSSGGDAADKLAKLFSYVRTESPFAGTVRDLGLNPAALPFGLPDEFRPPFDRIPTFREPGAVNLNTITDERVWRGILGQYKYDDNWAFLQNGPDWEADIESRVPFRSPAKGGRQATLLGDEMVTDPRTPLFKPPNDDGQPAFDPAKSALTRFEPLIRAASNTAPRSEMFAIWLTLGLFEVESTKEADVDPLGWKRLDEVRRYPQGYRLTREYGSASGEAKRYRAFYIIDRSRPVCYDEGADHNVDDVILIERFID